MSTEKLEEYKKLYSEYVNLNVELHNYHLSFLHRSSKPNSQVCKRTIKKMRLLLYSMEKMIYRVRDEFIESWREEIAEIKVFHPDGRVRRYNYEKRKKNDLIKRTIKKPV